LPAACANNTRYKTSSYRNPAWPCSSCATAPKATLITLASVVLADGRTVEGAAQLLDDRASLARAIAVIDAVLAAQLPGQDQAHALLAIGQHRLDEQTAQRRALLASTRVHFSLLGTSEEENDDA
jgi:phosphonate C-P lyase system protein PhnG